MNEFIIEAVGVNMAQTTLPRRHESHFWTFVGVAGLVALLVWVLA